MRSLTNTANITLRHGESNVRKTCRFDEVWDGTEEDAIAKVVRDGKHLGSRRAENTMGRDRLLYLVNRIGLQLNE